MTVSKSNHQAPPASSDEMSALVRSLIAERNRPMARWRPGPAPERRPQR
jgi:hypothetical protein